MASNILLAVVLVLTGFIIIAAFNPSVAIDRNLIGGIVIGSGIGLAAALLLKKRVGVSIW